MNWLSSDRKVWGVANEYQKRRGREKDPLEKIKFDGACFSLGDGPMSLTVRTKFFFFFFFFSIFPALGRLFGKEKQKTKQIIKYQ